LIGRASASWINARRNEVEAIRSTMLPAIGEPSSSEHPSARTCITTSVAITAPPPLRTWTKASARCCAIDGQRTSLVHASADASSSIAAGRRWTTSASIGIVIFAASAGGSRNDPTTIPSTSSREVKPRAR
jgi:hypothetical protein